jgi:hypothetical protein
MGHRSGDLVLFREGDERDAPGSFDGNREFPLVPHAIPGDAPGNDPSAFGQKIPYQPDILVVNCDLIVAKPTYPAALK